MFRKTRRLGWNRLFSLLCNRFNTETFALGIDRHLSDTAFAECAEQNHVGKWLFNMLLYDTFHGTSTHVSVVTLLSKPFARCVIDL